MLAMIDKYRFTFSVALAVCTCLLALHEQVAVAADGPPPTYANVRYGPHPRNVLDLWKVESSDPVPLVVMIHGGGWKGGDKQRVFRQCSKPAFERIQKAGISIAAINYRLSSAKHPVPAPLLDAARAIQFLRTKTNRRYCHPEVWPW